MTTINNKTDGVAIRATNRSRNSAGMERIESTIRIIAPSTIPPAKPATAPQTMPKLVASTATASATINVVWPPAISLPTMS